MNAVMNPANVVAIILSRVVFTLFAGVVVSRDWPRSLEFAMMAAMTLPVAIFNRLHVEEELVKPCGWADANSMDE